MQNLHLICDILKMPRQVKEDTARYIFKYKKILREQGRPPVMRYKDIAALVYLIARKHGIFRPIKEITRTLGFDNWRELFKSMKRVNYHIS
jgi:transcription initiation factor TFIIIB Brf1 subunit/transcription initiation factor TFIIB